MKRLLVLLSLLIYAGLQGTITDTKRILKPGYTERRLGFDTQEFRNRTPFDLYIVVYLENGTVKTVNVPKESRGTISTDFVCTEYFVVYPTSRLPGEPTPDPTSIYVNECNDRITFINYDYQGYFYSKTAHKI